MQIEAVVVYVQRAAVFRLGAGSAGEGLGAQGQGAFARARSESQDVLGGGLLAGAEQRLLFGQRVRVGVGGQQAAAGNKPEQVGSQQREDEAQVLVGQRVGGAEAER